VSALIDAVAQCDRSVFLALNHLARSRFMDWLMPRATDAGLGHVQAIAVLTVGIACALRARRIAWKSSLRRGCLFGVLLGAALALLRVAAPGAGVLGHAPASALFAGGFAVALWASFAAPAARAERWWVGPVLLALALSGLGATALKRIPRDRPWWYYEQRRQEGRDLAVHVETVPGVYPLKLSGFPSGHTATTVAMAAAVTVLFRRRRRALVAAVWAGAALVALSRIYLGSHWPLDLVGGGALGAACGVASVWLCRKWAHAPGAAPPGTARGIE
jgi:membrane-associated phospholipid phosphatase